MPPLSPKSQPKLSQESRGKVPDQTAARTPFPDFEPGLRTGTSLGPELPTPLALLAIVGISAGLGAMITFGKKELRRQVGRSERERLLSSWGSKEEPTLVLPRRSMAEMIAHPWKRFDY